MFDILAEGLQRCLNMNTHTLPIGQPPIIGYLHHAFPLAILSQDARYLPWFYGHYIQMHCPFNLADGPDPERKRKFNFYRPPDCDGVPGIGLSVTRLNRAIVLSDGLMPFIWRALEAERYVQVCVDEFYIPGKGAFQKRHLLHELFVYGGDVKGGFVETLGFLANGDFGVLRVSCDDLQRAFDAVECNNKYDPDGIRLFYWDVAVPIRFDILNVLDGLEDYVFSRNTSERFRLLSAPIDGVFGLATYRCLIDACAQLFYHPHWYDIRPLHILWEHKVCMLQRIRYLEQEGHLDGTDGFGNVYATIEKRARMIRMMMLKLRVSRDVSILKRIVQSLEQLAQEEGQILTCLLETLRVMPYVKQMRH